MKDANIVAKARANAGCGAENAHEANREYPEKRGRKQAKIRRAGRLTLTRLRSETAPTLAFRAKKIPTDKGWDFGFWWRRRESNPRPEILHSEFYILSHVN